VQNLKLNKTSVTPVQETNASVGFFFLAIYTILVYVRPHEWPMFAIEFPILRILFIIVFGLYIFGIKPKIWNEQTWLLFGLLCVVILAEFREFRFFSNFTVVNSFLFANLLPFILYSGYLQSHSRHRILLFISICSCLVMVQHSYTQVVDPNGVGWAASSIPRSDSDVLQARYVGIFNDPNDLGMFLVMNIPVAMYFFVNTSSFFKKVFYLSSVFLLTLGIYWTSSRGSLVGALVVFFSFFYIRYGKMKSILLGLLMSPIALFAMTKFRSISSEDKSANERIQAWYEGVQMFKYRPLFGVGKGEFTEYHVKTAHNSYVLVMAELGTVGFVLWVSFILLAFYMLKSILMLDAEKSKQPDLFNKEKSLALYTLVTMIGFCATAFFLSRAYVLFFYIFAAMSASIYIRASLLHSELPMKIPAKVIGKCFAQSLVGLVVLYFIITLLLNI